MGVSTYEASATLSLSRSQLNGCTTQEAGGGFYTQPDSRLQIVESVFERGSAFAGGVKLAQGSVYAANSTFRDSIGSASCGGLFFVGSGVSFVGEELVLRGLSSPGIGGALIGRSFDNVPATLFMRCVTVENCYATFGGSVMIIAGIMDLEQVALTQSGGLTIDGSIATIIGSVFANCTRTVEGGCMWASSSAVTMIESQLSGCTAPRGGTIFSSKSRLVLRNVIIADSFATQGSGGAVLLFGSSVLDTDSVTVSNCTAAEDGGAVSVVEDSRINLGGATILDNNVAAGSGGAVSVRDSELCMAPRCSFVVLISVEWKCAHPRRLGACRKSNKFVALRATSRILSSLIACIGPYF